jgi:hypothetical protein
MDIRRALPAMGAPRRSAFFVLPGDAHRAVGVLCGPLRRCAVMVLSASRDLVFTAVLRFPELQQSLAGVICEQLAVADVAFEGREAAVPGDIHHFEQACSVSCGRGEESGAQRVG